MGETAMKTQTAPRVFSDYAHSVLVAPVEGDDESPMPALSRQAQELQRERP